jgi:hypothetical protein
MIRVWRLSLGSISALHGLSLIQLPGDSQLITNIRFRGWRRRCRGDYLRFALCSQPQAHTRAPFWALVAQEIQHSHGTTTVQLGSRTPVLKRLAKRAGIAKVVGARMAKRSALRLGSTIRARKRASEHIESVLTSIQEATFLIDGGLESGRYDGRGDRRCEARACRVAARGARSNRRPFGFRTNTIDLSSEPR